MSWIELGVIMFALGGIGISVLLFLMFALCVIVGNSKGEEFRREDEE